MLSPKKTKWTKVQRGKATGLSKSGNRVDFGDYGLAATSIGFLGSRQIEAARVSINRNLKREGKLWIRVFPHKPITKRPLETRMGKGKGAVDHYVAVVKPGRIIFEVGGIPNNLAVSSLKSASHKLPIKTTVIKRSIL